MSTRPRSLGHSLAPVLGLIALATLGCASTIAAKYPHLERRSVCLVVPGIEPDSTEFVISDNNIPISNFHPEMVDRVAAEVRTVFEYDPNADSSSTRYLPAPYNELTCPERFLPLPSNDTMTRQLPAASVDLLLHEHRPEVVPRALAEKLASCANRSTGAREPGQYTMTLNVYVTNSGQAVSALVAQSTLGNRKIEACMVNVLRNTLWPELAAAPTATSASSAAPALKTFFAQPAPAERIPNWAEESGIRRIQPQPEAPRVPPRIFVVPIGPALAAVAAFGIIFFYSSDDAPAWASELNPITRQPYTSRLEYDEVQSLSPEEIRQRRAAHIKNSQSQPPPASTPAPASTPTPALTPKEQREQEKKREKCAKIAKQIDHFINVKRPETPKGGFPRGRKGIAERWSEIAVNKGKWQRRPDGSLSDKMRGHLGEYGEGQKELKTELDNWNKADCDDNLHGLPANARQYAAQTPEYGPGKPLEPAPLPEYRPPRIPPVIAPQLTKGSK